LLQHHLCCCNTIPVAATPSLLLQHHSPLLQHHPCCCNTIPVAATPSPLLQHHSPLLQHHSLLLQHHPRCCNTIPVAATPSPLLQHHFLSLQHYFQFSDIILCGCNTNLGTTTVCTDPKYPFHTKEITFRNDYRTSSSLPRHYHISVLLISAIIIII